MTQDCPTRRPSPGFRRRYDELELRRSELMNRLVRLEHLPQATDACRRAKALLNATFRKATLAQRVAVLQAAAWLIHVSETMIGPL